MSIVASATATPTAVDEGQPFKLDASGSTISTGAGLTYAWTQVSGPTVAIANPATAVQDLTAPEVTANGTAQFRVTASGGGASASTTVNVNFTNIVQSPLYAQSQQVAVSTFTHTVRTLIGRGDYALIGWSEAISDPLSFVGIKRVNGQLVDNPAPFPGTFAQPVVVEQSDVRFEFDPVAPQVGVVSEGLNRYRIYVDTGSGFNNTIDRTIEKPCNATYGTLATGATNGIFIGQRQRGFSILKIENGPGNVGASSSLYRAFNTGQSLCAFLPVTAPLGGTTFSDFRYLQDLIAIDTDSNTINVFTQANATGVDNVTYTLRETAPIQLNATGTLKLIKTAKVGGFFASEAGLAMVFSDGKHNGEHRLVITGLDSNRNLIQETHSWAVGVPVDVMQDNLDQDLYPEVVVVTSSSPYAAVFESTVPGAAGYLPLGAPTYFEIGLGASAGLSSAKGVLGVNALYIAFPDKKQVKLYQPVP